MKTIPFTIASKKIKYLGVNFLLFFYFLLFICAYTAWVISPLAPTPSLTSHSAPSLSPLPSQYPGVNLTKVMNDL
jgi:hypothetical protein